MSTNNTLTAKANEGAGTDALATLDLGTQGKAARVALIVDDGTDRSPNAGAANPLPVSMDGGATEAKQDSQQATLDAVNAKLPALDGGRVPIAPPLATASGNITTQNLVPAGVATANSAVEITLDGAATLTIQTTGTYTGALSVQGTINGVDWVTFGGVPLLNINTGGYLATITSALKSIFQADVTGFTKARVTGLAAVTGAASVSLSASTAPAMMALDAALPTGANVIGSVTSPTATNFKAAVQPIAATTTNKSGTITAGGTAQVAIALNANRRGFCIQNLSTADLWFSDLGTATAAQPSIKLVAGALYESMPGNCPTAAISIIGATTGQAFAARELT